MSDQPAVRPDGGGGLLSNVVVPVASEEVAAQTAEIAGEHLPADATVRVVHVVQDESAFAEASEAEWEAFAAAAFDAFRDAYGAEVETEIRRGTDIAGTIFSVADDADASAIVFVPRGGSRWRQIMSGDVARTLVSECDHPVVALPRPGDAGE